MSTFTKALQVSFERDGFVVLENVFSNTEASRLKETVTQLASWEKDCGKAYLYDAAHTKDDPGSVQKVWNLLNKGQLFRDLLQKQQLLDAMDWIFYRDTPHQKYYLSSFQAHITSSGVPLQRLHIDTPVPEPLPSWIIKANSIWILDDMSEINGATECVPGSHKFGRKPTLKEHLESKVTKVMAKTGSVLLTHGALWHRRGVNQLSDDRIILLASFAASFAREIANEENTLAVLDRAILENMPSPLKKILGPEHGIKMGAQVRPPDIK